VFGDQACHSTRDGLLVVRNVGKRQTHANPLLGKRKRLKSLLHGNVCTQKILLYRIQCSYGTGARIHLFLLCMFACSCSTGSYLWTMFMVFLLFKNCTEDEKGRTRSNKKHDRTLGWVDATDDRVCSASWYTRNVRSFFSRCFCVAKPVITRRSRLADKPLFATAIS